MGLIIRFVIIFSMCFLFVNTGSCELLGPIEVLSGNWGVGKAQFGLERSGSGDRHPLLAAVLFDGRIVISDVANSRNVVYDGEGNVLKEILWKDSAKCTDCENYEFWNVQGYAPPENIWIALEGDSGELTFLLKDPTGIIVNKTKARPLIIGEVHEQKVGSTRYKISIKYPEHRWLFYGEGRCPKYIKDMGCNIYCLGDRQVIKYNKDGDEIANLVMPENILEETPAKDPGVEPHIETLEAFGSPLVSPNGDIYAWKRTKDRFFIVKWSWRDGPDSPSNLRAFCENNRIVLKWDPPLEKGIVDGFEIERSSEVCDSADAKRMRVGQNISMYIDDDVSGDGNYYYKVRAVQKQGYSGYSNLAIGNLSHP